MATAAALSVRVSANIGDFEKEMKSLERSLSSTGSRLSGLGTKLTTGLTLPIIAAVGGAAKAAADFEESFAGVAKTVDGVADSGGKLTVFGRELQQQFRDLAKRIPVSVHELARIGEAAGAMGIPKDNIVQFTEVIAKLAATTNLTADQAAMSVGKIQGQYGALGVDTDRLASSLVALGNAGKSFEDTIVRAGERMAGTAVQARMSQHALLGWASAISDISAAGNIELTTTSWNRMVSAIGMAVDMGGSKLQAFANIASLAGEKLSASQFSKMWEADSSEGMLRFVEGLSQVEARGGNLTKVLNDLGFKTQGAQMTFKALAATSGDVRRQLELSATEWQRNAAMEEEFTKKSATTISQLKMLFNRLYDVGIELGNQFLPHLIKLQPAMQSVINLIGGMVQLFASLPSPVQTTVFGVLAFGAALGPVLFAVGNLITTGGALIGVFRTLGLTTAFHSMLQALTPVAMGARLAIGSLYTVVAAHPFLAVTAAIGGIIVALGKLKDASANAFSAWQQGGWRAVLGELGRNVNDDSASFFKEWRVDQQSRPGSGGPGKDINLPLLPKGGAAAGAGMPPELAALLGGSGKEAEKAAKEWQKELDRVTGREAIKSLAEWEKKVAAVGGATKLAAKDQKSYADALWEAVEAMKRLNQAEGPKFEQSLAKWAALQKAQPTTGMSTQTDRFGLTTEIPSGALALPHAQMGAATLAEGRKLLQLQAMVRSTIGTLGMFGDKGPQLMLQELQIIEDISAATQKAMREPEPGFLKQTFGSVKEFGASLSQTIMSALTGGGDLAKSIGGFLGGSLFGGKDGQGGLAGMIGGLFGDKGLGGMLGGALASIIPGIGNLLGSLLGGLIGKIGGGLAKLFGRGDDGDKERDKFLAEFGGFTALAEKLNKELGTEGAALFEALRKAESGSEATEAAEAIRRALEDHAEAIRAAMQDLPQAVNARAQNIHGQHDFSTVGAQALGTFQFLIQQGQSAMQAFNAITPAIEAMRAAMQGGNVEMTAAAERLFALHDILQANKIQFDNIAASGSILTSMLQAGIRDADLFAATAGDIGKQLQVIIDNGVPMSQAFALVQPQLQAIWLAQRDWGFAVDETTAALLAQAEAQGFVGEHMRDVNERILSVLIAIGDALGATIPDALRGLPPVAQEAANGMNEAFAGIRMPEIKPPGWDWRDEIIAPTDVDIPGAAHGAYVRSRPGGTLVNVGEGGRDEMIVPVGRGGGGIGTTVIIEVDGHAIAEATVPHIPGVVQRYGLA